MSRPCLRSRFSKRFSSVASTAAVLIGLASVTSGCQFRWVEGDGSSFDDDDAGWTWNDDDSASNQGSSGSGNVGSGGADATSGTTGGSDATGGDASGSGGADSGSGTGGYDDIYYCTPPEGTGESAAMCDQMAVSPAYAPSCEEGWEGSYAYAACGHGFEILNPGPAEDLAFCIAEIASADACLEDPVTACMGYAFDEACADDYIIGACNDWGALCGDYGDPFDVDYCSYAMTPLNDAALNDVVNCMNASDGTCQDRFDMCFGEVLTL